MFRLPMPLGTLTKATLSRSWTVFMRQWPHTTAPGYRISSCPVSADETYLRAFDSISSRLGHSHSRRAPGFSTNSTPAKIKLFATPSARIYWHLSASVVIRQAEIAPASHKPVSWHAVTRDPKRDGLRVRCCVDLLTWRDSTVRHEMHPRWPMEPLKYMTHAFTPEVPEDRRLLEAGFYRSVQGVSAQNES
jgi:hypothetical protein